MLMKKKSKYFGQSNSAVEEQAMKDTLYMMF